ncbi:hypothetical protein PRUPE_4G255500 [Prunus persica]|uniref:NAC domain-containing protein n=1 Tax=Prunus persica TaxID=3760 RepID=A0A251PR31_PRUPE|nr:hypothetical protein PRUPE_4G255500 [Prunus persica]
MSNACRGHVRAVSACRRVRHSSSLKCPYNIVGYKFRPSEEKLFLHYLLPRLNGEDYPKGVVPDCNLYGTKEPWEIWRDFHHSSPDDQEDIYVFTTLNKKTPNGSRFCRTVGAASTGVWKGED